MDVHRLSREEMSGVRNINRGSELDHFVDIKHMLVDHLYKLLIQSTVSEHWYEGNLSSEIVNMPHMW